MKLIDETLICPFWDDVNTGGTRGQIYFQNNIVSSSTRQNVMELIEESFGYRFNPTGVYTMLNTCNNGSIHFKNPNSWLIHIRCQCNIWYNEWER